MSYDPANWYWIVAGDETQVFSSARAAYVSAKDSTYTDWLKDGNFVTKIDSENSLWDVLALAYPAGIPASGQDRLKSAQISASDQIQLKIAFNHENRIRALEGKQPATQAQFIAAVKSLLS